MAFFAIMSPQALEKQRPMLKSQITETLSKMEKSKIEEFNLNAARLNDLVRDAIIEVSARKGKEIPPPPPPPFISPSPIPASTSTSKYKNSGDVKSAWQDILKTHKRTKPGGRFTDVTFREANKLINDYISSHTDFSNTSEIDNLLQTAKSKLVFMGGSRKTPRSKSRSKTTYRQKKHI